MTAATMAAMVVAVVAAAMAAERPARGRDDDERLRRVFEAVLAKTLSGTGPLTCTGLDEDTENALWAVWEAYPHASAELVQAARRAFAGQLDGSNAARWHADLARAIAGRRAHG
ncbi:hypothetical protein [Kitasatospora sp. NPDC094016]|uniref:hypothetical protein n=1 Tax=Kitasatospora sp. NPDC094016 TaxID=3154986 RepID=UPI0033293949